MRAAGPPRISILSSRPPPGPSMCLVRHPSWGSWRGLAWDQGYTCTPAHLPRGRYSPVLGGGTSPSCCRYLALLAHPAACSPSSTPACPAHPLPLPCPACPACSACPPHPPPMPLPCMHACMCMHAHAHTLVPMLDHDACAHMHMHRRAPALALDPEATLKLGPRCAVVDSGSRTHVKLSFDLEPEFAAAPKSRRAAPPPTAPRARGCSHVPLPVRPGGDGPLCPSLPGTPSRATPYLPVNSTP
jgi:hypothetical protein